MPEMSQNDVILVIKYKGRWYVVGRACNADNEWTDEFATEFVKNEENKFTYKRGDALCRAHDLQRKLDTEYGVWEIRLAA